MIGRWEKMNAYIFQGDLLCENCAQAEMDFLRSIGKEPPAIDDSDEWPVGPFPDGGGEADCPMYCGGCGVFLENPLTTDGERYVLSVAKEGKAPIEWLERYRYLFREVVEWEEEDE
jgi:hypothetical protein